MWRGTLSSELPHRHRLGKSSTIASPQASALSTQLSRFFWRPPLPLTDSNEAFSQVRTIQSYHPASSDTLPASTLPLAKRSVRAHWHPPSQLIFYTGASQCFGPPKTSVVVFLPSLAFTLSISNSTFAHHCTVSCSLRPDSQCLPVHSIAPLINPMTNWL